MSRKSMYRVIVFAMLVTAFPMTSFAGYFGVGIGVTVGFEPPPLPVYAQPPCPAAGYIWTPGYWAYAGDDEDYYWVPGTWVMAPGPGLLWTPGYWAAVGAGYAWNEGYWGPRVGFYGGINYGFGYFGEGFAGGYWHGNDFFYNRSVNNISNVNITNVYNRTVYNNVSGYRPSFNGANGIRAAPTHSDLLAARQPHRGLTAPQRMQVAAARSLPGSLASINHGRPQIAASPRPVAFHGGGVMPANGAQGHMARAVTAFGNRPQNSPATGHSYVPAQHGFETSRGTPARNDYQAARNFQAPRNYPQAQHGYQAPHNYQAPRNDRAYQAQRTYQAPRNYQARTYQAPRNFQAPQTYQAPRNTQQPHGAAPRGTQVQRHM